MLSTIDDCLKLTDLGGEKFEFSPAQANKLVVVIDEFFLKSLF